MGLEVALQGGTRVYVDFAFDNVMVVNDAEEDGLLVLGTVNDGIQVNG